MAVVDRFLPTACSEYCPDLLNEEGAVRDGAAKKETARRLDFSSWMSAWDRYAIGLYFGVCDAPGACLKDAHDRRCGHKAVEV